jgi:hypothetical protein
VVPRPGSRVDLPSKKTTDTAAVGSNAPSTQKTIDQPAERKAPAVDLNLSVVGELDLDLDLNGPSSGVPNGIPPGSSEADAGFPVLITADDGAAPKHRTPPGAEILLDFSLPDARPGPIKKADN